MSEIFDIKDQNAARFAALWLQESIENAISIEKGLKIDQKQLYYDQLFSEIIYSKPDFAIEIIEEISLLNVDISYKGDFAMGPLSDFIFQHHEKYEKRIKEFCFRNKNNLVLCKTVVFTKIMNDILQTDSR